MTKHSSVETWSPWAFTIPAATAACEPNDTHPDIAAPAMAPEIAPIVLLCGTSMPSVNTPNVVPAAMAEREVAN